MVGTVVGVKIRPFSYVKDGVTKSGKNIFLNVLENPQSDDVYVGDVSSVVEISDRTVISGVSSVTDLIGRDCLFDSVFSVKYHKSFVTSVFALGKGGES